MSDIELMQRRFDRERNARKSAEALLEQKSLEVFHANAELQNLASQMQEQAEHMQAVVDTAAEGIITYNADGLIQCFNRSAERIFRCPSAVGCDVASLFELNEENNAVIFPARGDSSLIDIDESDAPEPIQIQCRRASGKFFVAEVAVSTIRHKSDTLYTAVIRDLTRRLSLEARLNQAQKMESIGQLAAGVAHEINTPIQFVGDNIQFLEGAFDDLGELLDLYQALLSTIDQGKPTADLVSKIRDQQEIADLDFLREEFPSAIEQTMDGIGRVSKIVRAMKAFSQPTSDARTVYDLNQAIEDTLVVMGSQIGEIADVRVSLDPELKPLTCLASQMNQMLLNVFGNAVEAIVEDPSIERGKISITTRLTSNGIEMRVEDNGPGIPAKIRDRIFEPFFTTKEVGKGSGQGLTFVYDVIVDKHGGAIQVQSTPETGTTFIIQLPVANSHQGGPEGVEEGKSYANSVS